MALRGGRSEHNYGWPETYSVMIHHAVSGCFTCRKIICFNLPALQIHSEHHVLCKKVLWVAAQSLPLAAGLGWSEGWVWWCSPCPSCTTHPLSEKWFTVLPASEEGFLPLATAPHTMQRTPPGGDPHIPAHPLTLLIPAVRQPGELLWCRNTASTTPPPSPFPPGGMIS